MSRVHALRADEQLVVTLVPVRVEELDLRDRRTASGVVQDLLDDATDVTLLLGIIQRTELHGTLAGTDVSLEDGGLTLSLGLQGDIIVFNVS